MADVFGRGGIGRDLNVALIADRLMRSARRLCNTTRMGKQQHVQKDRLEQLVTHAKGAVARNDFAAAQRSAAVLIAKAKSIEKQAAKDRKKAVKRALLNDKTADSQCWWARPHQTGLPVDQVCEGVDPLADRRKRIRRSGAVLSTW